jgi:plastocyanin
MKELYAAAFGISTFFAMNCGGGDSTSDYPDTTSGGSSQSQQQPQQPAAANAPSSTSSSSSTITISGASFGPEELRVKVGTTVKWTWASGSHNVVSGSKCAPDGKFTSGAPQGKGSTFEHTFDSAGTFPYYCDPHCGMGMTGTVIVE